jgi:cell shape-determining protein MreD
VNELAIAKAVGMVVALASVLSFLLPPAEAFKNYTRFRSAYSILLILVNYVALNERGHWRQILGIAMEPTPERTKGDSKNG